MNKLTTKINTLYFSTLIILLVSLIIAWQVLFIPFVEKSERTKADLMLAPYAHMFEELIDEEGFDELDFFISSLLLLVNEENKQPLILMIKIDLSNGTVIKQVNEERDSIFVNKLALFSPSTFDLIGGVEVRYNDFTYRQIIQNSNIVIVVSIGVCIILFIFGQRLLVRFIRPLSTLSNFLNDVDTLDSESFPAHNQGLSAEIENVWGATKTLLMRIRKREDELKVRHEIAQLALSEKVDAESANRSKSQFLANMSHEIRTPLSAIIGFADTLQSPDISPKQRQVATNTIIRNGNHLLEIINDILDLSKIESDKIEIEHIEIPLLQLIHDVEDIFEPLMKEKGLNFIVDYHFPLPKNIISDPTRLRQILFNLLGNAKKFTENGSVRLSVEFMSGNSQIQISVKDSGIGLSDAQTEKIFSPFSQADASTTRKFGGTGLGLTISRKLAQMLGGDIRVVSTEGEGAEFILVIDAGCTDESPADLFTELSQYHEEEVVVTAVVTDVSSLIGNILIAEDTADIQDLLNYYLEQTSVNVTFANNGEEAFNFAINNNYDIVFMDMQMPVLDGLSATKKLRQAGFKQPIIALTANAMREDQELYQASGLDDFIAKPIDKNKFYKLIGKYVPQQIASQSNVQSKAQQKAQQKNLSTNIKDKTKRKRQTKQRLKERFKEQLPGWLKGISSGIREENKEELCRNAHVLKGLGGSFGYIEITELSAKIEIMGESGDFSGAARLYDELETFCKNNCGYIPSQ